MWKVIVHHLDGDITEDTYVSELEAESRYKDWIGFYENHVCKPHIRLEHTIEGFNCIVRQKGVCGGETND